MKQMKRAISLLAVSAMLISLLAGCQGGAKEDPVQKVMGYSKDTVFFTFDGENVTAGDYLFWLARYADYVNQMQTMSGAQGINWDEDMGGITTKDYIKQETLDTVKMFWAIEKMAGKEGFKLSKEDKATYQNDKKTAIETMGGQEAYDNYLNSMCLTDKNMERINKVSALAKQMETAFCREGGRFDATKDTVRSYMEEAGILKAKHILLLTKDPNVDGKAYSKEKVAQQKKLADDLLAQLRASKDPTALFDELMNKYSEDTGLKANPKGYLFSTQPDGVDFTSRMVKEFEDGTKALAYNPISDVIQSEYGYHIILRLDPVEDEDTFKTYQTKWWGTQMDKLYQERVDQIKVETKDAYNNLDVKDFFEKLQAYRETLPKTEPKADAKEEANTNKQEGADQSAPAGDATGNTQGSSDQANQTESKNAGEGTQAPAQ
ncbi:MAG: peptidylprolyl isomerase [Evtepia sp.]|nr:peptidylprolyl isomerase [Evtepia sp.]